MQPIYAIYIVYIYIYILLYTHHSKLQSYQISSQPSTAKLHSYNSYIHFSCSSLYKNGGNHSLGPVIQNNFCLTQLIQMPYPQVLFFTCECGICITFEREVLKSTLLSNVSFTHIISTVYLHISILRSCSVLSLIYSCSHVQSSFISPLLYSFSFIQLKFNF